ncbi:MAG: O-antigen ligase family protein [Patescibacteria group bacterium]
MLFWRKIARPDFLRLSQVFFGLGLFCLPFQIRSLVYFGQSYSRGFFDEYLAFFIQASEIFFLLAFVWLGLAFIFQRVATKIPPAKLLLPFGILFACEILILPLARDPLLALLHFWRTLEFAGTAFFIASGIFGSRSVVRILAAALFFQAALGTAQFFAQGDLGLHFLGEPFFDASTFNIAKTFSALGEVLPRGLGTLAHANILGGLAALTLLALANYDRKHHLVYFVAVMILAGLFFSFSRAAVLAFFAGLTVLLIFQTRRRIISALAAFVVFGALLLAFPAPFFARFGAAAGDSISRLDQIFQALEISRENPLGVGRSDFTAALAEKYPDLPFYALQPVHNFFVLKTAEESVFVALAWLVIFAWLAFWSWREKKFEALALLVALFLLANWDHYFASNFAGEAFWWIVFGLVIAEISSKAEFKKSSLKSART